LTRWLSASDKQRPFFAFLNYFDAHSPYLPPKPFDEMFGLKKPHVNPRLTPTAHWAAEEIQAELDAYDGGIAYLDQQLALLLQELDEKGVLENTLVIITSDHGEEFYEHRVMAHGWSTYLASLHVPLLISFPGRVPEGRVVTTPVTLRDLGATVLGLLDVDRGAMFPGTSLERFWNNPGQEEMASSGSPMLSELTLESSNLPEWYPIRQGDMKSLVIDRYHYIRDRAGHEEFYDFESDPLEQNNLAGSEAGRQKLDSFRAALKTILQQSAVRSTG
jgi:arylsulfatase A-like enzyme